MKLFSLTVILLFCSMSFGESFRFKGMKHSSLDWEQRDPLRWTDYQQWLSDVRDAQQSEDREYERQDQRNKELMGRVLACHGECRLYRERGYHHLDHYSSLKEGDEIETMENSYLWLFFADGTLVRLSPQSSLALNEINIGSTKNFLRVRLNFGHMNWLARDTQKVEESSLHETDPLFFPLKLIEANPPEIFFRTEIDEDHLQKHLEAKNRTLWQTKRLNQFIEKNNQWIDKPTYSFIVLPNITIEGLTVQGSFFVSNGGVSYGKIYSNEEVFSTLRGYEKKERESLDRGEWFQVDALGKERSLAEDIHVLELAEIFHRRIPTLYLAREIMLDRLSKPYFLKNQTQKNYAALYGLRLWENPQKDPEDLNKRIQFLSTYVRRVETSLGFEALKLSQNRGVKAQVSVSLIQKAMESYLNSMPSSLKDQDYERLWLKIWRLKNAKGE